MRANFPEGSTLVSTTDLKGRIRHCNASFIEVSGFTREELLGQPHNLVRHPDTAEEGFRDLGGHGRWRPALDRGGEESLQER